MVLEDATYKSDKETRGNYEKALGASSSTRYNGRVWSDKSVSTGDVTFTGAGDDGAATTTTVDRGDSDFLVTFSTLATSTLEEGESQVPVDVVFVIDNSNSMDDSVGGGSGQSRLEATVDAVNASIAEIMSSHEDSRVAVVLYGLEAETLLPLGHYSASEDQQHRGDYIWYDSESDGRGFKTTFGSVNSQDVEMRYEDRGTNIHLGVDAGMDILKSATSIGEEQNKHVPALVLLSDGAATSSGDGNWWDPSGRNGDGTTSRNSYVLKVAMNAQYNKQLVNQHYGVTNADSDYACKVYTIGMGIEQLNTNQNRDNYRRAQMALDPGTHLEDDNGVANDIKDAWDWYTNGKQVTTGPWWDPDYETTYTPELDGYTFEHPGTNDIKTIAYNDDYFTAENADDVANVFDDITSSIVNSRPQVPTKVEGDNPVQSGFITYTDPIGEYMHVDSVKSLIWMGTEFTNPDRSESSDGAVTYTFQGKITSPAYPDQTHNASEIQITVTTDESGNQELEIRVPASAIPLRVNTVKTDANGVITNSYNDSAYPLRVVYGVSIKDDAVDENGNIDASVVSDEYLRKNTTTDGKVNFYSNLYSGNTQGTAEQTTVGNATVEFQPASTNPFYFVQGNTPIYYDGEGQHQVQDFNENETYYVPVTYYNANKQVTTYVERAASSMNGYVGHDNNGYYIVDGAPRLGNLEDFQAFKGNGNLTNTAESLLYPTYVGTVDDGKFVVYLGNNGLMQLDAPASLTLSKAVTADGGLTAPEDAEFTFTLTAASKANAEVDATLRTQGAAEQPVTLVFDAQGAAQIKGEGGATSPIKLKANQSLEIPNMAGVEYSIQETELPDGFTASSTVSPSTAGTYDGDTKTMSGTVATENTTVAFTNNYSVTPVTSDSLNIELGGTKTIDGRDFQQDDVFTFTIAAAQATPDAPLPMKDGAAVTEVTASPTSGSSTTFEFDGTITFTKPGEYRYIIRENQGSLPGVDYDTSMYRLNIFIVDNGDGTLRLARTDEITDAAGNLYYPTNPLIQKWGGEIEGGTVNEIKFENHYSATEATASIQGMKVLDVTNSDRKLADDDSTFKIEALGYNTDGGDTFSAIPAGDPEQPMPGTTTANNIANGNVQFGSMTFTQDMIGHTYGYKITEYVPAGVDADNKLNGVTYDTSEKIVKVTVTRSDEGGAEHVVATVTPNDGTAEAPNNFTFTNKYEPTSITIGTDTVAGIKVSKTLVNREWLDGDKFEFTIKNTLAPDGVTAPMPAETTVSIEKDTTNHVVSFGEMAFVKEGVYTYEITENEHSLGGVSHDDHVAKVTVTVTEDTATGTLSAKIEYNNSGAESESDKLVEDSSAFTNTYKSAFDESSKVSLDGTKNLVVGGNSDRALGANDFFFEVTPLDGAPTGAAEMDPGSTSYLVPNNEGADDDGDKTFTASISGLLREITFEQSDLDGQLSKDFAYIITEQQVASTTMTFDDAAYRVTVTATDDGTGTITAKVSSIEKGTWNADEQTFTPDEDQNVSDVVFTNSYMPEEVTTGDTARTAIQVVKSVTGAPATEAFEFSLSLAQGQDSANVYEGSGESKTQFDGMTLTTSDNIAAGARETKTFGSITFTAAGDYTFTIDETTTTNAGGWTYDSNTHNVTVHVADRGGKLTITGIDGNAPVFTNNYVPNEVVTGEDDVADLQLTKEVTGAPALSDFTFQVKLTDGDISGVKRGSGESAVALTEDGFEVSTSGLTGKTGDEAKQTVSLGSLTFTKTGDYTFTVTETTTTNEPGWGYASGDGNAKTITVHVTDDGFDGQLDIKTEGGIEGNNPVFINSYVPDGITVGDDEAALNVVKKVADAAAVSEFEFTLTLTDGDATGVTGLGENNSITKSTQNLEGKFGADATETVSFGKLTFTKAGDYTFTVTENNTAPNDAWTYQSGKDNAKTIVVHVTDENFDGQLDVAAEGGIEGNGQTFTNTYEATGGLNGDGQAKIEATKTLSGRDLTEGEFTFNVTTPYAEEPVSTGTNVKAEDGEAAAINFSPITYQISDLEKWAADPDNTGVTKDVNPDTGLATYTIKYTVSEKIDGLTEVGVTPGDTSFDITVTVADQGDGTLDAKVNYPSGTESLGFTNTYDELDDSNNSIEVNGKKTIVASEEWFNAPELPEGKFQFTITGERVNAAGEPEAGNPAPLPSETTVSNKADGTVDFGAIEYTVDNVWGKESQIATMSVKGDPRDAYFKYTITESGDMAGVTNADAQSFTVHVHDDGQGHVTAEVIDGTANGFTFENTYTPSAGTVEGEASLKGTKVLEGRNWYAENGAETFGFTLTPVVAEGTDWTSVHVGSAKGEEFSSLEATATENGKAQVDFWFDDLSFSKPGTYTFNVTETSHNGEALPNDGTAGMTYDRHVGTITVTVTDNRTGTLQTSVEAGTVTTGEGQNNLTFTNVYFDEGDAKDVFFADDPQTEVDGKLVGVGDKLTYTVDWAATKAGTVMVTDKIPAGTALVEGSIDNGGTVQDGVITWTFADQALGASGTVSFSVTVNESAVDYDVVRNSATIAVGDHEFTTNTTENPVPEKEETTKPGQIGEGTVLTYRISFTNADGDNASAKVVDTLTKGQAYVEGSASVAPTSVTGSAATGQTLTWDLTGLADNQQVTITFDVTITRDAGASVDNTATVNDHKTNTTTTPYPADDEKDVAFADAPTTSIDGKLVGVGDELVYTIDWAADESRTASSPGTWVRRPTATRAPSPLR